MPEISTLYVANHTHTDIGYTDHQRVIFRQLDDHLEQAMDIVEATAGYPEGARFCWTLEVSGPVQRWLRHASEPQRERLRRHNASGAIDIGAMQYNTTPLLNPEQMIRTLLPVHKLREQYGLRLRSALQNDVNGVAWLFADLLPAIGIDLLTMGANQVRGRAPRPLPGAFWWQGPAGGRLLTWNGLHYLFGRSVAKLADERYVERDLRTVLRRVEQDPDYPFDFLYLESTHPVRVDNGPPQQRMSDFVRDWNAAGRTPRIELTTPTAFGDLLRTRHGDELPTWHGDWTDWWADGAASSAYETGLNRTSHELVAAAEAIASWLQSEGGVPGVEPQRIQAIYDSMSLYDEHTWGAFSAIDRPDTLFTQAVWSSKADHAYTAAMESHDVLARSATRLAAGSAHQGAESRFNLGDLDYDEAFPDSGSREWLVINTLPYARRVLVSEPEVRAGGAPRGMLDMFFPRDVPWGGARSLETVRQAQVEVPGNGWRWADFTDAAPSGSDLAVGPGMIENAHYRLQIDPETGGLASWLDKDLDRDFAGQQNGHRLGEYVYDRVLGDRSALFADDFSDWDFGHWPEPAKVERSTATRVTIGEPVIDAGTASIEVTIEAEGVRTATCRYALPTRQPTVHVDWQLDKLAVTDPESVYIAFPFALERAPAPQFRVDLNGIGCRPGDDQLTGAVRDFHPLRRWVDVSDSRAGVTVATLDAPLMQLGDINTGNAAHEFQPEGPAVYSWALNNHWMVNFRASQQGEIGLRYRLTTHAGPCDDAAANRFAADVCTPALVLRDWIRESDAPATSEFVTVDDDGVELNFKLAEDGDGIIVRLRDVRGAARNVSLRFAAVQAAGRSVAVRPTSILEVDEGPQLEVRDGAVSVPLPAHGIVSFRVRRDPILTGSTHAVPTWSSVTDAGP